MTSQSSPGTAVQAPAWAGEVPHFFYLVDPEERLQLGWRAHELVLAVAQGQFDLVFFLDKSGRPLQHLFRKAWQRAVAEGEMEAKRFPKQVGFLHIGKRIGSDDNPRRILHSKDLPQLTEYYLRKLRYVPKRVLVVDEIVGTGATIDLAFDVILAMFPNAWPAKFLLQDMSNRTELFNKPGGIRQVTWKLSFEDDLSYGLQGVTDVMDGSRTRYLDILAYRPSLRCDWREQLWAMEEECLMEFGINLRHMSPHLYTMLDTLAGALAEYSGVAAKRGSHYLQRTKVALLEGLPRSLEKPQPWVPVHEDLDKIRALTREQLIWIRFAACYMEKLGCMVEETQHTAGGEATTLAEVLCFLLQYAYERFSRQFTRCRYSKSSGSKLYSSPVVCYLSLGNCGEDCFRTL